MNKKNRITMIIEDTKVFKRLLDQVDQVANMLTRAGTNALGFTVITPVALLRNIRSIESLDNAALVLHCWIDVSSRNYCLYCITLILNKNNDFIAYIQ